MRHSSEKSLTAYVLVPITFFHLIFLIFCTPVFAEVKGAWPTEKWLFSTPEQQGVSSAVLSQMFTVKKNEHLSINSVLLIRNGYIILEANKEDTNHLYPLYSTTKSVTSALMGIAIEQDIVRDVEENLFSFFAEENRVGGRMEEHKEIKLLHLLTMTSGLEWPEIGSSYAHHGNPVYQMEMSSNWVDYILSKPQSESSGTSFNYNSGNSHLLMAVLHKKIENIEQFAHDNLFAPMGIKKENYIWSCDPQNIPNGSHGLAMMPRDMAKFGLLYLNKGRWKDQQLIPERWIEESTSKKTEMNWNGFIANHYGYAWYIQPFGYHSLGYQGQYVFVLPDLDMVAVFTSELHLDQLDMPVNLVRDVVIPAIKGKGINEQREAYTHLQEKIQTFNNSGY